MWRSQRGSLNPGSFIFYGIPTTGSSFTSIPQVSPLSNGLRGVASTFCATFADAESVNSTSHQPESQNASVFLLRQRHCKPGDSHVLSSIDLQQSEHQCCVLKANLKLAGEVADSCIKALLCLIWPSTADSTGNVLNGGKEGTLLAGSRIS